MTEDRVVGIEAIQAAFEKLNDALVLVDDDRVIRNANPAACALLQKDAAALVDQRATHLPERIFELTARGENGRVESDVVLSNGKRATFSISVTANVFPGRHLFMLRDVTERRQREMMSERYELLARHTHDIVLFLDRHGRIVEANDAAIRAYGYSREEILQLGVINLRAPESQDDVQMQIEHAFSTGIILETVHRRKDSTTFPVEVGSRSAMVGGELMLLSVIRDITDRRQIQAGLVQVDRLSTFGMMAAGIAHEINNPLAYAITNIDVLARRLAALSSAARPDPANSDQQAAGPLASGLAQCAEMILIAQEGVGRVRSIVRDLKMFSRDDHGTLERVDIRSILESSINIARGEIRHRARVVRDYGEAPFVEGSSSRLGQVFLNLLVNAAQAIPDGRADGEIRVVTRTASNGDVIVDVIDNGIGIEEHSIDRIFEPFMTTKPAGEGTGLGLHIARTIARAAGGEVSASSRVGVGTTMRVTLPSKEPRSLRSPNSATGATPAATPAITHAARILIIDDEQPIGFTLRALLSPPHEVAITVSAVDALVRIDAGEIFDVIFCDIMMPEITGIKFHEIVTATHPDITSRIVFMTGGISAPEVHKFLQATGARCLEKPFTDAELEAAIREVRTRTF
ncbi:MAG: ATP-binding protein [Polyangiaceae bacterium]